MFLSDVVWVDSAALYGDLNDQYTFDKPDSVSSERNTPWAENMAASTGCASSKVIDERAMKACRKARLQSL